MRRSARVEPAVNFPRAGFGGLKPPVAAAGAYRVKNRLKKQVFGILEALPGCGTTGMHVTDSPNRPNVRKSPESYIRVTLLSHISPHWHTLITASQPHKLRSQTRVLRCGQLPHRGALEGHRVAARFFFFFSEPCGVDETRSVVTQVHQPGVNTPNKRVQSPETYSICSKDTPRRWLIS